MAVEVEHKVASANAFAEQVGALGGRRRVPCCAVCWFEHGSRFCIGHNCQHNSKQPRPPWCPAGRRGEGEGGGRERQRQDRGGQVRRDSQGGRREAGAGSGFSSPFPMQLAWEHHAKTRARAHTHTHTHTLKQSDEGPFNTSSHAPRRSRLARRTWRPRSRLWPRPRRRWTRSTRRTSGRPRA
jgi:hypothetical protein